MGESIPKTQLKGSQKRLQNPNMIPFNKENCLIALGIQREIES